MLNQCNFIGRLGKDPEVRYTAGGDPVCNFSLACGEKYKDKNGNSQEKTEWINIVIWGKLAEIAGTYLKKGSLAYISGKFATGSMVVFTRGQRDSSSYRRFRIKNPPIVIPNDFEMIKEVLRRRFKNDWPHPDLIVVDGGKGQVSSAKKILLEYELKIPLIGLAKRQETIITEDFKEIKFSKIPAFNLLKKIRDEAHRFAITYHKKLRDKSYFRSTL